MLDPRNVGQLTLGIVQPPEVIDIKNGKIVKLRVAVPFAGQESQSEDRRGFFDVTFFATDDNPNTKFVLSQIANGNFKPGTNLQILYRLQQERWSAEDGSKRSRVVLVAESMAYAGGRSDESKRDAAPREVPEANLPERF